MQSNENGGPSPNLEIKAPEIRAAWEQPRLHRLETGEAEAFFGSGPDLALYS